MALVLPLEESWQISERTVGTVRAVQPNKGAQGSCVAHVLQAEQWKRNPTSWAGIDEVAFGTRSLGEGDLLPLSLRRPEPLTSF